MQRPSRSKYRQGLSAVVIVVFDYQMIRWCAPGATLPVRSECIQLKAKGNRRPENRPDQGRGE